MIRNKNRRAFLRAVGAGFATLPFFRLLENSYAQAAGDELPLKFIGVYHPHGVAAELWAMKDTDTETNFNLTYTDCSLQPFDDAATYGKSYKSKIMVLEGVDLLSSANGHSTAGTILTGSRIDGSKDRPQNISLDQFLAVEKGLGSATRIASVALGVGTAALTAGECLSFGPGGAPLAKIIDPAETFKQLFAGFTAGNDAAAQAIAKRESKRGQSVIDFVRADIGRLRSRLAPEEQQKLDQHLTSLREIEKQLATPTTACALPTAPDASKFPKTLRYNGGEPFFDAITDAHIDLLAQAMACDITRFATLYLADLLVRQQPAGLPRRQPRRRRAHLQRLANRLERRARGRRHAVDLDAARQVQPLLVRKGRAPDAEAGRVGRARQHADLRLERHGQPRAAQHAQRADPARGRFERQVQDGTPLEDAGGLPHARTCGAVRTTPRSRRSPTTRF
ncbi:MAG: DUF1552 domain-containing protein [Polyangiaceae bacterium]